MLVTALLLLVVALSGCADAKAGRAESGESLLSDIKKRDMVRIGVRVDNPPHSFLDKNGDWVGFDIDIANAIAEDWDVRLELVRVDELTRISFLQNGKIDLAVASISKTKKRGQQVDFSQTYFHSVQTFLVRKGEIGGLKDLVGKRVGADRGSSAVGNWKDWVEKNGNSAEPEIVEFGDKHAAVAAVRQGAIAGWAEDYEILASYAKDDPSLAVLDDPAGIGVKLDGIAIHRNDSELMMAVNTTIQNLATSGDYDTIYDRWFGPSSDTPVPRRSAIEVWPNG